VRNVQAGAAATPHSGYHFDGTPRRFFEGWYFRVSLLHRSGWLTFLPKLITANLVACNFEMHNNTYHTSLIKSHDDLHARAHPVIWPDVALLILYRFTYRTLIRASH
jgi:hypothetical protein